MARKDDEALAAAFAPVRAAVAALDLPETLEGLWYGTPAFKVRGKGFTRLKDPTALVIFCPLEEKEMLLEAAPEIYFETDHYRGWPALLVRVAAIADDELRLRLERSWLQKAPASLIRTRAADP